MPAPTTSSSPRAGRSENAYHRIRQLIVAGRLSPGARLVEADIAGRFGVSRGAIRPALQRLRQEGLATAPGIGRQARLIVAPLTRSDATELCELLGEIEGLAASEAARLKPDPHTRLIHTLRDVMSSWDDLGNQDEPDPVSFLDRDRSFHQAIVVAGGGPRVMAMHDSLRPQLERYALTFAVNVREHLEAELEEHVAIISCLEAHDSKGSHEAMRRNWRHGARRLGRLIERMGERGDWHSQGSATVDSASRPEGTWI